jgi:hypothetical protein
LETIKERSTQEKRSSTFWYSAREDMISPEFKICMVLTTPSPGCVKVGIGFIDYINFYKLHFLSFTRIPNYPQRSKKTGSRKILFPAAWISSLTDLSISFAG